jgi:predicted metalloprotease with PDZ domain
VSGDKAFARDFFARYIQGHEVADYARLLARAGFGVRKRNPGRAWLGDIHLESRSSLRVAGLVAPTWPIYTAGIDEDDELQQVDGHRIVSEGDIAAAMQRHKPGDQVPIVFVDRSGVTKTVSITLAEDPHTEVVAAAPTAEQKAFRDGWLGAK